MMFEINEYIRSSCMMFEINEYIRYRVSGNVSGSKSLLQINNNNWCKRYKLYFS